MFFYNENWCRFVGQKATYYLANVLSATKLSSWRISFKCSNTRCLYNRRCRLQSRFDCWSKPSKCRHTLRERHGSTYRHVHRNQTRHISSAHVTTGPNSKDDFTYSKHFDLWQQRHDSFWHNWDYVDNLRQTCFQDQNNNIVFRIDLAMTLISDPTYNKIADWLQKHSLITVRTETTPVKIHSDIHGRIHATTTRLHYLPCRNKDIVSSTNKHSGEQDYYK